MANHLVIDLICPEVSKRSVMCQMIDLDKVEDGYVAVEISRELAERILNR